MTHTDRYFKFREKVGGLLCDSVEEEDYEDEVIFRVKVRGYIFSVKFSLDNFKVMNISLPIYSESLTENFKQFYELLKDCDILHYLPDTSLRFYDDLMLGKKITREINMDAFIIEDKVNKTWKSLIPFEKVDYCYFSEVAEQYIIDTEKDSFDINETQFNKYLDWLESKGELK